MLCDGIVGLVLVGRRGFSFCISTLFWVGQIDVCCSLYSFLLILYNMLVYLTLINVILFIFSTILTHRHHKLQQIVMEDMINFDMWWVCWSDDSSGKECNYPVFNLIGTVILWNLWGRYQASIIVQKHSINNDLIIKYD